jgi:hypothetical protein
LIQLKSNIQTQIITLTLPLKPCEHTHVRTQSDRSTPAAQPMHLRFMFTGIVTKLCIPFRNQLYFIFYFDFNSYRRRYFKLTKLQFKPIETDVAIFHINIFRKNTHNSLKLSYYCQCPPNYQLCQSPSLNYRKMSISLVMIKIIFIKLLLLFLKKLK